MNRRFQGPSFSARSLDMDNKQKAGDINAITSKAFSKMTGAEKAKHIGKILIFFISFGFAFPNVFTD